MRLLASLALPIALLVSCSSNDDPARACVPGATQACVCTDGRNGAQTCNGGGGGFDACVCTADAGADTKPATVDTGVDTAVPLCDQALPSDFACTFAKRRPAGASVCTEAQLQELVKKCIGDPISKVPAGCSEWKAANAACVTCISAFSLESVTSRAIPDRNMCYWATFDDACDKALNCSFDCQAEVCVDCDDTSGSGPGGKGSEYSDCTSRSRVNATASKPKGLCWDVASKEAAACLDATDINHCIVKELYTPTGASGAIDIPTLQLQAVEFFRGACRDGGDWTNALSPVPKGADAGVDAAGDGG